MDEGASSFSTRLNRSGKACQCRRRWTARKRCAAVLLVGLHAYPAYRHATHLFGQRDKIIFPFKASGRWCEDGSYVTRGSTADAAAVAERSPRDFGVEDFHCVKIPVEGELNFHRGYLLAQPEPSKVPTLVWFYSRCQNVGTVLPDLCQVYKTFGVNVICVDLRGFGACPGEPSELSIREDARRIVKYVATDMADEAELPRIDPQRLFIVGEALGSHAALEAASHPEVRNLLKGAIVSNSFTAISSSLAACRLPTPQYYTRACFPEQFDNVSRVANTSLPLLFLGSTNNPTSSLQLVGQLAQSAKFCPHTSAIINGAGELNGLAIAEELPQSFRRVIHAFFEGQVSPRPTHYFESSEPIQKLTGYHNDFDLEQARLAEPAKPSLCAEACESAKATLKRWNNRLQNRLWKTTDTTEAAASA